MTTSKRRFPAEPARDNRGKLDVSLKRTLKVQLRWTRSQSGILRVIRREPTIDSDSLQPGLEGETARHWLLPLEKAAC